MTEILEENQENKEIVSVIDSKTEREEAEKDHIRNEHGFFISASVPISVIRMLHVRDHNQKVKSIYYVNHNH